MKLATTTGSFAKYDISEQERIRLVTEAGFQYIDFDFGAYKTKESKLFQPDFESFFREIRKYAESLGAKFVQAHAPDLNLLEREKKELHTQIVCRTVEACGILGIENLVIHAGFEENIGKEEFFERNLAFFRGIFPTMERWGVNLLIENTCHSNFGKKYYFYTAQDMVDFINYANHPLLHAVWDVGHANAEGEQYSQIQTLGKHLYALHIHDNDGKMDNHDFPFTGTMNWDALMHALIDVQYKGYFTMECGSVLLFDNQWSQSRMARLKKVPFEKDTRLFVPPLEIRFYYEQLLFKVGTYILNAYGLSET